MEKNHDRCMVMDDEADDINYSDFQSVGAERIPMKMIENLSDIWVPAHLLNKRKNFAKIHLNKPAIFRTLEKPEKSFSVYNETVDHPENFPAVEFAQEDMLDILNNYKSHEANDLSGSDVSETEASSEINNYESLNNSCGSDRFLSSQKESLSPQCLEKNSETLTFCDKDTYDYVKSACLKTFSLAKDDSAKNSFDDIYDSNENFCEETRCSMSEKVLNEKCDYLDVPLNISEAEVSVCIGENLESDAGEGPCCNPDFEGSLQSDLLKKSEMDYVDPKELDESGGDTDLVNFPIAYKRPVIEETVKKPKNQKKKKNAMKKNVLDVFTQNDDSENPYPERDEFYESVMNREYERVMSRAYEPYEHEYPSLKNDFPDKKHYNSQNFTSAEVTSEFEEFKETETLMEDNAPALVNSRKPTNISPETEVTNIILENVPKHVTEEQVQALLPMGEVRSLYLSKCGWFKIAEISLDSDTDAEWIIDCFNGGTPFGAGSSALKCYKLS